MPSWKPLLNTKDLKISVQEILFQPPWKNIYYDPGFVSKRMEIGTLLLKRPLIKGQISAKGLKRAFLKGKNLKPQRGPNSKWPKPS